MPQLRVHLFGKFAVFSEQCELQGLDGPKVQELFAHLLLQQRPLARESLAELLWSQSSATLGRKYLRQTLWQLQTGLDRWGQQRDTPILFVETHWIRTNTAADVWVDVRAFEEAAAATSGLVGSNLTADQATALQAAVQLYQGNLLEGWYQDWCLFERERLQLMYLAMLDKLISYAEVHQAYEAAVVFGELILRCDRAEERAHRRLMQLHYLAGDRTAALRQYDRCATALAEEFDAAPSPETTALRSRIKDGQLEASSTAQVGSPRLLVTTRTSEVVGSLKHVLTLLADLQRVVEWQVRALESPRDT